MGYFDYCAGLTMASGKFERLFGGPRALDARSIIGDARSSRMQEDMNWTE